VKILTLDEKITLKGELVRIGTPAYLLVRLSATLAAYLYWRGFGRPVSTFASPKKRRT
jgi:hypothetical protein